MEVLSQSEEEWNIVVEDFVTVIWNWLRRTLLENNAQELLTGEFLCSFLWILAKEKMYLLNILNYLGLFIPTGSLYGIYHFESELLLVYIPYGDNVLEILKRK